MGPAGPSHCHGVRQRVEGGRASVISYKITSCSYKAGLKTKVRLKYTGIIQYNAIMALGDLSNLKAQTRLIHYKIIWGPLQF